MQNEIRLNTKERIDLFNQFHILNIIHCCCFLLVVSFLFPFLLSFYIIFKTSYIHTLDLYFFVLLKIEIERNFMH